MSSNSSTQRLHHTPLHPDLSSSDFQPPYFPPPYSIPAAAPQPALLQQSSMHHDFLSPSAVDSYNAMQQYYGVAACSQQKLTDPLGASGDPQGTLQLGFATTSYGDTALRVSAACVVGGSAGADPGVYGGTMAASGSGIDGFTANGSLNSVTRGVETRRVS